ncbi:cytochrome c maturation protein CcmE [Acetonema longum]|uniref:Cytochrome c-type biogenesis protein CcmE, putative n=1 Tax=Acetonema longum DSM 6540 TaxID=1009370 RepID=F7NMK0_9FIRM|nr:cytochrome c maturation protein CcmE [Acetonema longum]EGO62740.1 cytochrome c-type biogenesis protein CcmE, putative [Acetonema longum DSM 6540]
MKRRHLVGLAVIALFVVYSAVTFSSALTPYVTFSQAKSVNGTVQVRGVLINDQISVLDNGRKIQFTLRDEAGEAMPVTYGGVKPDGLAQASSIVAVGKVSDGQFYAEKLLVKCPSKYQGSVKK